MAGSLLKPCGLQVLEILENIRDIVFDSKCLILPKSVKNTFDFHLSSALLQKDASISLIIAFLTKLLDLLVDL